MSVSVQHEYSVKIVNPQRMSDFKTVKIMEIPSENFTSLDDMRDFFSKNLPHGDVTAINEVDLGYFEPGHGAKGKKVWLCQDSDLKPMYKCHATKRMISCWCYSEKKSRKRSRSPSNKSSNYEAHSSKKMAAVETVYDDLKKKHEGGTKVYTPEQLRAWSHLIEMGKHSSYEEPPDKPFFRGRKKGSVVQVSSHLVSPVKKVSVRWELIDQLEKWHRPASVGAISNSQYDELKGTILSDIQDLSSKSSN